MICPFSPTAVRVFAILVTVIAGAGPARAQTAAPSAVDQRALDRLGPAPVTPRPPPRPNRPAPAPSLMPSGSAAAAHAHPPAPPPPPQVVKPLPPAPPPPPVLPPPIVVPVRPSPPPPLPPIKADAPGGAFHSPDGLRLTFGAASTDLNPATDGALRDFAHTAPLGADTSFTVTAFAAGAPDDPSAPRRLSLSRALAVRSVLMAEGVASIRIYVKALGAAGPEAAAGPPDRVDVSMTSTPRAGPVAPSQAGQPPAEPQKAAP